MSDLKAPFPAFGGKRKVGGLVWDRLGDVANYIEPFCNSAAVLLLRPSPGRIETVNDVNDFIANFWRAVKHDPEAVVAHADHPVIEVDLHARHKWLVGVGSPEAAEHAREFHARMVVDPDYFDAKVAGWWVYGACLWIGSGWCEAVYEALPRLSESICVHTGPPELHRPQVADAHALVREVHSNDTVAQRRAWLLGWIGQLSDRLRTVRVCCGDWRRVCDSDSVTTRIGDTGIFLDPPYRSHLADGTASRTANLYAHDRLQDLNALVNDVIAYCVERGGRPGYRIAACCYEGEGYEVLRDLGWECVEWKAPGGYANRTGSNANAGRERIWFSPGCRKGRPGRNHHPLFASEESDHG